MTDWPDVNTVLGQARSEGYLKTNLFNPIVNGVKEQPGGGPEQALTLDAGGTILPALAASKAITVDSFSAAATDNLDFISQTNAFDGSYVQLRAVDAAHVITLKHNTSGTGKLWLRDEVDYILDDVEKKVVLQRRGTIWYEVWRSHEAVFESALQTITLGTTVSVAHGLGVKPRQVAVWLECVTTEDGYAVGDRLALDAVVTKGELTVYVDDSTNIKIAINTNLGALVLQVVNKSTLTSNQGLIIANWKFLIMARA